MLLGFRDLTESAASQNSTDPDRADRSVITPELLASDKEQQTTTTVEQAVRALIARPLKCEALI